MLRVVKKEAVNEEEAEGEERFFKKIGAFFKKKWDKQTTNEALKRDWNRRKWIEEQGFTPK
ncbi:hypothetical protein V7S43_002284 [Phytophthora oleae]|uniref:RxLR effector protein n=1 Tax=Phytophthora oleae TaxID=2107226 RepID=A0ABD3G2Z5_9STRA